MRTPWPESSLMLPRPFANVLSWSVVALVALWTGLITSSLSPEASYAVRNSALLSSACLVLAPLTLLRARLEHHAPPWTRSATLEETSR